MPPLLCRIQRRPRDASTHVATIIDKKDLIAIFGPLSEHEQASLSAWAAYAARSLEEHEHVLEAIFEDELPESSSLRATLTQVWLSVASALRMEQATIDQILYKLISQQLLPMSCDSTKRKLGITLIHVIMGLQTMLYSPVTLRHIVSKLMIRNELGFEGQGIMSAQQDFSNSKSPLFRYLVQFGVMLPSPFFDLMLDTDDPEKGLGLVQDQDISPATLNARLLRDVAHVKFRWTDSIACHLEFDKHKRQLLLFRHPSFCAAVRANKAFETPIHFCAKSSSDYHSDWAMASEVSQLMLEVLRSYRILFGLDRASRTLIPRKLNPFDGIDDAQRDALLLELCGSAQLRPNTLSLDLDLDRKECNLSEDFPMLFGKLARLKRFMDDSRPRSFAEYWVDKRNSAGWMTLWVVLIIGFLGLLLSLAQVILGIIQVTAKS